MSMTGVQEEIEGFDEGVDRTVLAHYPLEDIMVRTDSRTVGDVVKRIEAGRYLMHPDFQREFVWPLAKQSKLIESCVMRIPLPVFYVAESEDGRITVVDGLQRLSTFQAFLNNRFKLTGLGEGHPLEGKRFSELPIGLQERIEDTQLTLYILDKAAPEAARLDIFDRVNSGIPLSRQQMRNALHNGPATQWLADMARQPYFLSATGGSLAQHSMRDREAINRFAAFYILGPETYGGDMDLFLARGLSTINRRPECLSPLTDAFQKSMALNEYLFGKHAFRKSLTEGGEYDYRSVINISMFDAFSVILARADENRVEPDAHEIRREVKNLLDSDGFKWAISLSTNGTAQVRTRFLALAATLSKWLD